jgi:hypothetical protein
MAAVLMSLVTEGRHKDDLDLSRQPNCAKGSRLMGIIYAVRLRLGCLAFFLFMAAPAVAQDDGVALVKVLEGSAFTIQGDDKQVLSVGSAIRREDVVETASGTVGLTFKDGSRISIGPNSRIEFKKFEFSSKEGKFAFFISIIRGTMLYISGIIAKLSPEAVKIETPVATVVVRGTRFLAKVEGD